MFKCELCGQPIEAGICGFCIQELGVEVYQEHVENAQDNFLSEWCIDTTTSAEEEEYIEEVTRGVITAIMSGVKPVVIEAEFPLSVGCLESTPCSVCGCWSTGLCCE